MRWSYASDHRWLSRSTLRVAWPGADKLMNIIELHKDNFHAVLTPGPQEYYTFTNYHCRERSRSSDGPESAGDDVTKLLIRYVLGN